MFRPFVPPVESLESRVLLHGDGVDHPESSWRINSGGGAITTDDSKTWRADSGYTGGTGKSSALAIANTSNDALYSARRYGASFGYNLPTINGQYTLRLYFAEPFYSSAGARKFDVTVENQLVLNDYDIVAQVGAKAAVIKTFAVNVADGNLDIDFKGVVDNAIVSAIELTPASGGTTQPPPVSTNVQWTSRASSPMKLAEAGGLAMGGALWVFGGYNVTSPRWEATSAVHRYNPGTNSWSKVTNMPQRLTHIGTATDGRYAYLAGGYVTNSSGYQIFATDAVYRYDTQTNSWLTLKSLPSKRGAGALALVGRELHFIGGLDINRVDQKDHWVLNLDSMSSGWRSAAPLPINKNHAGVAVLNGAIYLVGGQSGHVDHTSNQSSVYKWIGSAGSWGSWTQVAGMSEQRSHNAGSTFVHNGRIITVAGISTNGLILSSVVMYDPGANKWTSLTNLPGARHSTVAASIGGKLYVSGGYNNGLQLTTWVGNFI